jgi:hypothetical protein
MKPDSELIIGNKTYKKLQPSDFLDLFKRNTRCNMALPGNNNGTVYDRLALCNHLYDSLIPEKVSWTDFLSVYELDFKMEYLKHLYNDFNPSDFNSVYYADGASGPYYNSLLLSWGCPYSFRARPRTGLTVIFDKILQGIRPMVFGFSINSEIRKTFYVKDHVFQREEDGSTCHNKDDELKIIRWLHENNKIDITPCMLQDCEVPTINCEGLKPSQDTVDLLKSVYPEVRIQP